MCFKKTRKKFLTVKNFWLIFYFGSLLFPPSIFAENRPSLPAVLKADRIEGDKQNNILNAIGNVELKKDDKIILANELQYNQLQKEIEAKGKIKIINYDIGNILATNIKIKDDFNSGSFDDARIVFNDGSYIKSPEIIRQNESTTVLQQALFSFCPNPTIAEDNEKAGQESDLLSLDSSVITINKEENYFKSKNSIIKLYKLPILYIPYLKAPLPSSKRKSGFLRPSYINNNRLGAGFTIPYYFNLASNYDLTTTLQYHPSDGHLILQNEYRSLLESGSYDINLEIANNEPKTNGLTGSNTAISNQDLRWYGRSKGNLSFKQDFNNKINNILNSDFEGSFGLNFNINNLGDKNYLRDYRNDFIGYTTSNINFDYIKDNNYASIKILRIQELEVNQDEREEPIAAPIINHHIESKPQNNLFGSIVSLSTNSTIISRESGLQYRRFSTKPKIKIPFNIKGNLFSVETALQGDFYNLENNFKNPNQNQVDYDKTTIGYRPEFNFDWSLPLINKSGDNTLIIEPLAKIAISSYDHNNSIPTQDSKNTELTYNNLFLSDRLTGFDRNESGQRLTFGFRSSFYSKLGEFNLGLGQSYRKNNKVQDVVLVGFGNDNRSNIVGEFSYKADKIFSLIYNFQLSESNYRNDINELNANLDFKRVRIGTNYILLRRTDVNSQERQQLDFNFEFDIGRHTTFGVRNIRDLVNDRIITKRYGLTYNGCCVSYGIAYSENNPAALTKPNKSYNINFTIKNL